VTSAPRGPRPLAALDAPTAPLRARRSVAPSAALPSPRPLEGLEPEVGAQQPHRPARLGALPTLAARPPAHAPLGHPTRGTGPLGPVRPAVSRTHAPVYLNGDAAKSLRLDTREGARDALARRRVALPFGGPPPPDPTPPRAAPLRPGGDHAPRGLERVRPRRPVRPRARANGRRRAPLGTEATARRMWRARSSSMSAIRLAARARWGAGEAGEADGPPRPGLGRELVGT